MLSCSRVIGRFSKVAGHTHTKRLYRPVKYVGVIGICNARYSSTGSGGDKTKSYKPPGTTIKPEECVPNNKYVKPKKMPPACGSMPDGSCPPCYDVCNKVNNEGDKKGKLKFWKHAVGVALLAGVIVYAVKQYDKFSGSPEIIKSKKSPRKRRRLSERIKVPSVSANIPNEVPYLLIGGGTAAFSAFRSIKSRDPKAKVLVITDEEDLPYMRPPLSKELWYNMGKTTDAQVVSFKQWNGTQRSLFYEPQEFYLAVDKLAQSDKGGVAVATGWKVSKIDVMNKVAILEDGHQIKYEKCLIATGASPKSLPVFEAAEDAVKEKIIPFRTKEDFLELEENVYNDDIKNIVIVGGGFLGSELACSLARNLGERKKVYQIYKEKFIMAQVLPEYLSEWTTKKALLEGVHCIPNAEVEDYSYRNGKLTLQLTGDQSIETDQVIVAVGVEANTNLAKPSELEVDPKMGGFLVNAELEARNNVWVAGDAACFYDVKLGRRRVEHHDHAVISGRLAGENMTGAGKPYLHQSMFWSDLGPEVGYEAIGIIDSSLPTVGVFAKATAADTPLAAVSASNEIIRSTSEQKGEADQSKITETGQTSEKENKSKEESKTDKKEDEADKKEVETAIKDECVVSESKSAEQSSKHDDFGKGVIFYLRDDIVVGVVLWNIFNRISIARQVLARGTRYDELNEVAKLFTIHDD